MLTLLSKIRNNKNFPFIFIILAFSLCIGFINFPFGKWLLGWDNIVPELNFIENFRRGFFSLWQENEGLGLNGGHGFPATLLHTTTLFLLSFIFPTETLRPIFHLLMYSLGGMGIYFLFLHLFRSNTNIHLRWGAFLSSLFYLLNFSTVQMFYIPLEAFSVHFAFLPWLLFSFFKLIHNPSKKNIAFYCLISLLSSMQGFIPPLFIVYVLFLGIAGISGLIRFKKEPIKFLKRFLLALAITIITNAYWLLPLTYYTLVNSHIYLEAYNNITQTSEFILKNQKFGNFSDMVFMRGFIYESGDVTNTGKTFLIFQPWIDYFNNPIVSVTSISLFIFIIFGIIWSLYKKSWEIKAIAGMFLITFIFLATNVPFLSNISEFIRNSVPILKQAFRIPFTKFAVSISLFYSLGIGFGFIGLVEFISHIVKRINLTLVSSVVFVIFAISIFFVSIPLFQGNLFYKKIHVDLPNSYLELFDYLKTQDSSGRIAHFPATSPTGWTFYKWGYTGSGFLWYGLSQPILDRNFDVWNNYNENFYWEANHAIYAKNEQQFEDILSKYNITWLLVDEQIVSTSHPRALFTEYIHNYMSNNDAFEKDKSFGDITLYKRKQPIQNIILTTIPNSVAPEYKWNEYDKAFEQNNIYKTNNNPNILYPYRSLFTARGSNNTDYISLDTQNVIFTPQSSLNTSQFQIVLPTINQNENAFINLVKPSITSNGEIKIPIVQSQLIYSSKGQSTGIEAPCWPKDSGDVSQQVFNNNSGEFIRFNSQNATSCRTIALPSVEQRMSYLIAVKSRNIQSIPLKMWVENLTSRHVDQQFYLKSNTNLDWEYFILPPLAEDGLGYTIHFDNISIGNKETVNDLAEVIIYPIPYEFITNVKLVSKINQNNSSSNIISPYIEHPTQTSYSIFLPEGLNKKTDLILWQSFHKDWNAYIINRNNLLQKWFPPLFGTKINSHIKVNNWANGWELNNDFSNDDLVVILFWPQIFQYIGFTFLLLLPFFFKNKKV